MSFGDALEAVGKGVDVTGVAAMIAGGLIATLLWIAPGRRSFMTAGAFVAYRHRLGRAILLGLEFLVAGDIIRTVAVTPTFRSLGVLAIIVLIRTFLSMSLEMEISGRWPWQKREPGAEAPPT